MGAGRTDDLDCIERARRATASRLVRWRLIGDPPLQRLPGWKLSDKRAQHRQRGCHLIVVQDRGEGSVEVVFDLAHRSGGVDARWGK